MNPSENKSRLGPLIIIIIIALALWGIYQLVEKGSSPKPANNSETPTSTAATSTADSVPTDWSTYVNNQYGYQLRYPSSVKISKEFTVANDDGTEFIKYKAGDPIPVKVEDMSATAGPNRSRVTVIPLYVEINVIKKPAGYSGLQKYVNDVMDEDLKQGENSAAGVYASVSATTVNNMSGYLLVVSDGSVVKNRDDKYYFEHGDYIYAFDMAYSGYAYETKDSDEVMRVDVDKMVLSSFKYTR